MFSRDFTVTPFRIDSIIKSIPRLYLHDALIISNTVIDEDFPLAHFTRLRFYNCVFTDIRKTVTSMSYAEDIVFTKCTFENVESFDSLFTSKGLYSVTFDSCDLSNIKSMSRMFEANVFIQHVQFTNNDTRNLLSISRMFSSTISLYSTEGLSTFDVSNVEDMSYAFFNSYVIDIHDLKFWNVSKVKHMLNTFSICYSLNDISPLRLWNVSNVMDMYEMFARSHRLKCLLPLSLWNVSKVENMSGMFMCDSLTSLHGLERWDVSNVKTMSGMFLGSKITSLQPLQHWNMSKDINTYEMFGGCKMISLQLLQHWRSANVKISV